MSSFHTLWDKDPESVMRKDAIGHHDQIVYTVSEPYTHNENLYFMSDDQVSPIAGSSNDVQNYKEKDIYSWSEEDSFDWAFATSRRLCNLVDLEVPILAFKGVTGRELMQFSESDFCELLDDDIGGFMFRKFTEMVSERQIGGKSDDQPTFTTLQTMGAASYHRQELGNLPAANHCKSLEILAPNGNFHEYRRPIDITNYHSHRTCEEIKIISDKPIYNSYTHAFEENNDISNNNINIKSYENTYQGNDRSTDERNTSFDHVSNNRLDMKDDFNNNISPNSSLSLSDDDSYMKNDIRELIIDDSYFTEDTMTHSTNIYPSNQVSASSVPLISPPLTSRPLTSRPLTSPPLTSPPLTSSDKNEKKAWFHKLPASGQRKKRERGPICWEFLLRLLQDPQTNPTWIKWEDAKRGVFRLVQKEEIARLWGSRMNKPIRYENFARLLRHHYKKSQNIQPVYEQQTVYKFGEKVLEDIRNGKKW